MQMKAYRVCNMTRWGHEDKVKYFRNPVEAEKEFHKRVKEGIESEDLPTRDQLDGGPPWKVKCGPDEFRKNIKMRADIRYWDSCHTDCGTEYDIEGYEIIFDQIEIA